MRVPILSFSLAASALLSSGLSVAAQTKAPSLAEAAKAAAPAKVSYSAEPFVIEHTNWVYSENADGTGFREHTVAVKMQSEPALREFGVITVPFASASEHVELVYVRVRHEDGSVTETPASGAIEQPEAVTKSAPFYSDLKDDQLPVKNLKVGDTLEWKAKVVRTRAEAVNQFWGQERLYDEGVVILDQTAELRVPAASTVNVWTNPRGNVKPVESVEGGVRVYRWSLPQLKATTGPEADAEKKLKKGKMLTDEEAVDAEEGKLPTLAWTTFPSWEAVGSWYRGLEANRAVPDDEIKAKVKELTANSKTEEDKVRAVYAYVSAQIRYVGVAFGVGRYQPHEAADVLHSQYGDCKDKATLLSSMLEAIGLSPDSVLIGAGVRFNEAVPSPSAFNHLITRVKVGDEEVWLDATQEVAPYKALMFQIRDKNALVVPDKGEAKVERSPKELPFASYQTWMSKGTISKEGVIESHITLESRGDVEMALRSYVHEVPPSGYGEFGQKFLENLGYGGTTSHVEFSRPEDSDQPFKMSLDYKREKNDQWGSLKIIPEFLPVFLPAVDEKDPPTQAIDLSSPMTQTSTVELKLPEGWSAQLPEAIHEHTSFASEDVTYRVENGTLYAERKLVVLQRKLPASRWREYKKFTDGISLGYDNWVVLIRPGASGKAVDGSTHISKPEAESLIGQAFAAVNKNHDLKTGDLLVKRAKTIDPEAKGLWACTGWIAFRKGKYAEAEESFRKEMSLYPNSYYELEYIARSQWQRKQKDEAIATLREWTANDSENANAWNYLASYLLEDDKPAEAADAAAKSVALTPATDKDRSERRTMVLGKAQLKAGQIEKGTATLKALLESTDSANMMNDAAYELADAKQLLPLDDVKIHEALKRMSAESQAWTLDEAPDVLISKSNLLVAAWDSFGWILYREGKTAESQSWIQAAYLNRFHDEVKTHLDTVNTALGREAAISNSPKSMLASRTYDLGSYSGGKGTAEYLLLLQHGKVVRAKATGTALPGVEELLKGMSFAKLFPEGSEAQLVRGGFANCSSSKCEFVLEP